MRLSLALLTVSLVLVGSAAHAGLDAAATRELLERSQKEKKGVTVYVPGHTIAIVVTAIGPDVVEGKNQEYQRVVIDAEDILAVALP
jgi:hypothetical protein